MFEHRPTLQIEGNYPTGKYLVPRRLMLELSGLPVDEDSDVGGVVIDALEDVVRRVVGRLDPGTWALEQVDPQTWPWVSG